MVFPSPDGFHNATDLRHQHYRNDEFDGIDVFPFVSTELSLLAVSSPAGRARGECARGTRPAASTQPGPGPNCTGATNYDQDLHRDYLNHTVLVPTTAQHARAAGDLSPPQRRSRRAGPAALGLAATHGRPTGKSQLLPSPRRAGTIRGRHDHADLYDVERAGRPGWHSHRVHLGTFHRGTPLTKPRGARYTMHLGYRPARVEWCRQAWADRSHTPDLPFVHRPTPRQLELFGFPPPKHPFWNPRTLIGLRRATSTRSHSVGCIRSVSIPMLRFGNAPCESGVEDVRVRSCVLTRYPLSAAVEAQGSKAMVVSLASSPMGIARPSLHYAFT